MATTVHLPGPLLAAADRKAGRLGISRNRLIVRALERELTEGADWSPRFFEKLAHVDEDVQTAVDDVIREIRTARRSKKPRTL